jgi:diguanylate cyclase (GGDEF)-like protein/PAS domain S-box-containing protein
MTSASSRVLLLVEDNPGDARLFREMLDDQGPHNIEMAHVERMSEAEEHLSKQKVDIILLDLGLPDEQGLKAVRRACAAAPRVPLVVLTGSDDESLGVQALHEGAQDFLVKGQIEPRGLFRSLRYAIERKGMEQVLLVQKERAETTLNCIGDAIICTDIRGNITFLNVVAEQITGWSRQEATGQAMGDVFKILDATTRKATPNRMEMAVRENRTVYLPSNSILIRRDGGETPIEDSASPIHDDEGQDAGAVIVFRDVSAARAMSREMHHSAVHDPLTGLPNRALLKDRISQAIALAPRHASKVAVLFLDLDGFKHINDSLGHAIGDKLLQSIAARLVACVRESDTVSRQGGDEFVVLLSEVERLEDAATAARRIVQAVAEPHSIDQHNFRVDIAAAAGRMLEAVGEPHSIDRHELHVTASIGLSVYPDDGLDAETLIQNADTAMYQAKEKGHQNYQFFKPDMNVRAVERQFIEESLRRAVERREFALHYQPVINLTTGEITGAEALIRWMHPTRGLVPPLQFIPVAEDCGLIVPIGRWVLREACRQARVWVDAGLPAMSMAVNVSAVEFRHEAFLEGLFATLDETGLDPRLLVVELTESVLMTHDEGPISTLHALRERGIQVAIDDFGTGYSSLSYLRKFPLDALKIDQSFVRQISTVGDDTTILTAVISIAHGLKLRVIAEGVETPEELAFLRAHQCDEAQGYYFSRPVVPEQFARLLRTGVPVAELAGRPGVVTVPAAGKVRTSQGAAWTVPQSDRVE